MNSRLLPHLDTLRSGRGLECLNELLEVWALDLCLCLSAVQWDCIVLLAVGVFGIHFLQLYYYLIKNGRPALQNHCISTFDLIFVILQGTALISSETGQLKKKYFFQVKVAILIKLS